MNWLSLKSLFGGLVSALTSLLAGCVLALAVLGAGGCQFGASECGKSKAFSFGIGAAQHEPYETTKEVAEHGESAD